jgi:secreted PhoX family phosphatase
MGAFAAGPGRVRLVRNHETDKGAPFSRVAYDPETCGGTTTLEFDVDAGRFISARGSLSGTMRNCAGGPTPWRVARLDPDAPRYVFEVPADGVGNPSPLRDMGRFSHEAVAIDPITGYVYETEDTGASLSGLFGASGKPGFYRFVPHVSGQLAAGGRLFMLEGEAPAHARSGRRIRARDDVRCGMGADCETGQSGPRGARSLRVGPGRPRARGRDGLSGDFTASEWAGPCYSPDGRWLFANIYHPGITVAITGPWQSGAL